MWRQKRNRKTTGIIAKPIYVRGYNFLSTLWKVIKTVFSPHLKEKIRQKSYTYWVNCPVTNKVCFDVFLLMAYLSNKLLLPSELLINRCSISWFEEIDLKPFMLSLETLWPKCILKDTWWKTSIGRRLVRVPESWTWFLYS